MEGWNDEKLAELERSHPEGMSVQQIVDAFTGQGERLTEATFRKYVQLGLLPRSTRVGRKGKHLGSIGLYPVSAIRQIDEVRRLMAQGFTIEEIQTHFLFVRGDIDALGRQLDRVFQHIDTAQTERAKLHGEDVFVARALHEARAIGVDLMHRLERIEKQLSLHARMARAAV